MEDKMFELMTKLYSEFSEFRKESNVKFDNIDSKFDNIDSKFDKIDSKFDKIDSKFDNIDSKFDNIDSKFNRLETEVKGLRRDVIRIENDLGKKVDAALDGYQQVYEKQLEHDKRFDSLEGKMQKQDVEIRVIKGGANI